MSEVQSKYVDLSVADGSSMRAWVATPPKPAIKAGLMVFQEAFGVNHHIRALTDRFAEAGYLAIAPELYHRSSPGFEGDYADTAPAIALAKQMTREGLQDDIRASYAYLQEQSAKTIACTGYCMGGRVSFLANTTVPLSAAVSYYGGGLGDVMDRAALCSAPILFFWGGLDKHITGEQRQKVADGMQACKHRSVQVVISDADHGYFCDERTVYNAGAAKLSWNLTMSFLDQQLENKE